MALVCPDCSNSCDSAGRCAHCGPSGPTVPSPTVGSWSPPSKAEPWQQTPGGRLVIGVLLGVGLSYGLLHLCAAMLHALGIEGSHRTLDPLSGLFLFQALQAVALFVGGIFIGAGQRRGAAL